MSAHAPSGSRRRLGVRARHVNGAGEEVFGRRVWVTSASCGRIWSASAYKVPGVFCQVDMERMNIVHTCKAIRFTHPAASATKTAGQSSRLFSSSIMARILEGRWIGLPSELFDFWDLRAELSSAALMRDSATLSHQFTRPLTSSGRICVHPLTMTFFFCLLLS